MNQFTKEEAIAFGKGNEWEKLSYEERAALFLGQKRLCMPFSAGHEAVENVLGRAVFTHEIDEWNTGERPTFEDIIGMLDKKKDNCSRRIT